MHPHNGIQWKKPNEYKQNSVVKIHIKHNFSVQSIDL